MIYRNQTFDQERALYGVQGVTLEACTFRGAADGESALKESADITVRHCVFALRYPFWHTKGIRLEDSRTEEGCRAALWYCEDVDIRRTALCGVKALRECQSVRLERCTVSSAEFGWLSRGITVIDSILSGEYAFLHAQNITADRMQFSGKYSFQYTQNVTITNSVLKTKDAFWHSKNVTVCDSVIEGEYLGWYAENLRLVRCHIKGTQPLCYARGLILEDCTMEEADLAFEKSELFANIKGTVTSIKAPAKGSITADAIGDILPENDGTEGGAVITVLST